MCTAQSEPDTLWGVCALMGNHGTGGDWSACPAHGGGELESCVCGGRTPHIPIALGCCHGCDPGQVRSYKWAALPGNFTPMSPEFGAPAGAISSVQAFFGLPSSHVVVNGKSVVLRVRPAGRTLREASARGGGQRWAGALMLPGDL